MPIQVAMAQGPLKSWNAVLKNWITIHTACARALGSDALWEWGKLANVRPLLAAFANCGGVVEEGFRVSDFNVDLLVKGGESGQVTADFIACGITEDIPPAINKIDEKFSELRTQLSRIPKETLPAGNQWGSPTVQRRIAVVFHRPKLDPGLDESGINLQLIALYNSVISTHQPHAHACVFPDDCRDRKSIRNFKLKHHGEIGYEQVWPGVMLLAWMV